jgi:tungstate transport system substrate-binding protein
MLSALNARLLPLALLLAALAAGAQPQPPAQPQVEARWGSGSKSFSVATGSPGELGLLEALAKEFAAANDATVLWFKAGSGQAMRLLQERKVDMVLAHAPAAERRAVADGWATGRRLIGSNEFWIVGPAADPAGIARAADAADAMRRIHASGARFVSRGDNSGTHQKEVELWRAAGVSPGGASYIVTREFMTASLKRANAEGAYFLTDSSTFIAERVSVPQLQRLFRGGDLLSNPYHTLYLADPTPGAPTARQFGEFLAGERAQAVMRDYGRERYGEPMYKDAAATALEIRE